MAAKLKIFPIIAPQNIPARYAELIGRIVVAWSFVELALQGMLATVLGVKSNKATQIARSLRLPGMLNFLEIVLTTRLPDRADVIARMFKDIRRVEAERNSVVHDLWWKSGRSRAVQVPRRDVKKRLEKAREKAPGITPGTVPITKRELKELLEKIDGCQAVLTIFHAANLDALQAGTDDKIS
jgi:hypothetical protein